MALPKITSVVLQSLDRPDIGRVIFSLYASGAYILDPDALDGWAGISGINTAVDPYQIRNGSNVSTPNQIAGKVVGMITTVTGANETQAILAISKMNGILQTRMKLTVVDNGIEYFLNDCALVSGSYDLKRISPKQYVLGFSIAASSAYRIKSEIFQKVISGGGDVISGGIIYPLAEPYDDEVSYPDYDEAYVTVTSIQQGQIIIDGNGEIYPKFTIAGTFYEVIITHTDFNGLEKVIHLFAQGAVDVPAYHIWTIDTEALEVGFQTPNISGAPLFDDNPIIQEADWFILNVGKNIIEADFGTGGSGVVTAEWQERYL